MVFAHNIPLVFRKNKFFYQIAKCPLFCLGLWKVVTQDSHLGPLFVTNVPKINSGLVLRNLKFYCRYGFKKVYKLTRGKVIFLINARSQHVGMVITKNEPKLKKNEYVDQQSSLFSSQRTSRFCETIIWSQLTHALNK